MSSHTRTQLIHLAPEEMLFKRMESLKIPDYIVTEIWEQKNFFSASKMEKMNNWNREQFLNWHEESL
jgi:hypothetical protein